MTGLRIKTLAALLAVAGSAASSSAGAAVSPTAALRNYLAAMKSIGSQASIGLNFTDTGLYFAKSATDILNPSAEDATNAAEVFDKSSPHLQIALDQLQFVKAPAGMAGPQANLKAGIKRALRVDDSLPTALRSGNAADGLDAYVTGSGDFADAEDLVGEWRDELIVQLRRHAITVPLWVKKLGHELTAASQP